MQDFDEAIRLNPNSATAFTDRGWARYNLAQFAAAVSDYNEALRLDTRGMQAYVNRAAAYTRLHRDQEAALDVARAIELGADPQGLKVFIDNLKQQR